VCVCFLVRESEVSNDGRMRSYIVGHKDQNKNGGEGRGAG